MGSGYAHDTGECGVGLRRSVIPTVVELLSVLRFVSGPFEVINFKVLEQLIFLHSLKKCLHLEEIINYLPHRRRCIGSNI